MLKVVYAKDYQKELMELLKESNMKHNRGFTLEQMELSVKANSNLRYNINTGVTYRGKEKISWYSNTSDIDKNMTVEEILQYEFLGWISNSADRLKRGHSVLG